MGTKKPSKQESKKKAPPARARGEGASRKAAAKQRIPPRASAKAAAAAARLTRAGRRIPPGEGEVAEVSRKSLERKPPAGAPASQKPSPAAARGKAELPGGGGAKGPAVSNARKLASSPATQKLPAVSKPQVAPKPPAKCKIPAGELAKIREALARKKRAISSHIQTELSELEKPEKRHRADLEEMASDTHDTDSLCEIMDIEVTQIDQIDQALLKIDNGSYGVCEDCGGEIPFARLEALPFATQCIECKRRAEVRGKINTSQVDSSPNL